MDRRRLGMASSFTSLTSNSSEVWFVSHLHQQENQGFGLYHKTLTPARTPRIWTVSQDTDTSKNTKALAVTNIYTYGLNRCYTCNFTLIECCCFIYILGDSGGVVNSLDFCPASLKSLGCFYFRCVLSSQWKAVTVNLRILHCQR